MGRPISVDGRPRRHGRLELSVHGLAEPKAQLNDTKGWHVILTAADLRWLLKTIPAALDGIAQQRKAYELEIK